MENSLNQAPRHPFVALQSSKDRPLDDVVVSPYLNQLCVAVIESGIVQELYLEKETQEHLIGNLYLGKVLRVLPGMQSAFINIGLDRAAFLHASDLVNPHISQDWPRIEHHVFDGQSIVVQVMKAPLGNKGARVTRQISLAGRFLVYLPLDLSSYLGISQKIADPQQRDFLRKQLEIFKEEQALTGGLILRTNGEEASFDDLKSDLAALKCQWQEIQNKIKSSSLPSMIHQDLPLHMRILRDVVSDRTQNIYVTHEALYQSLKNFCLNLMPDVESKLLLEENYPSAFERFNIQEVLQSCTKRRVDLDGGAYLVIDQTEALVSIDVNTGGFIGHKNLADTILETNMLACEEIARQVRLRNLGGIIVVDFIDMHHEDHQRKVLERFEQCLALEKTKITLSGFSGLGLVELTRKRTRPSILQHLCQTCEHCQGLGWVYSAASIAQQIIYKLNQAFNDPYASSFYKVIASVEVVDLLNVYGKSYKDKVGFYASSVYDRDSFDILPSDRLS